MASNFFMLSFEYSNARLPFTICLFVCSNVVSRQYFGQLLIIWKSENCQTRGDIHESGELTGMSAAKCDSISLKYFLLFAEKERRGHY